MQQQEQQHQQQQQMEDMSGADLVEASMVLEQQYGSHQQGPDETQGAAEAMVQLSAQYSYYQVGCTQATLILICGIWA